MRLLFGPYGCTPIEAVTRIAKGYLEAGATLPTVNGFFLRELLHRGEDRLYRDLLQRNCEALLAALGDQQVEEIAICLGPAQDCYRPDLAPDVEEAFAFAHKQYRHCQVVASKWFILHETIGTWREALGISLAAQSLNLPIVVSIVVDPQGVLLDGTSVEQAITVIDRETDGFVRGFSLNCCSPFAFERAVAAFHCPDRIKRLIGFYPNSWDAHPSLYETAVRRNEPDKRDSLRQIAEIGRKYQLQFIGGCCGFNNNDVRFLKYIL